jgi:DNA-binding IclR family transcriptional regulator
VGACTVTLSLHVRLSASTALFLEPFSEGGLNGRAFAETESPIGSSSAPLSGGCLARALVALRKPAGREKSIASTREHDARRAPLVPREPLGRPRPGHEAYRDAQAKDHGEQREAHTKGLAARAAFLLNPGQVLRRALHVVGESHVPFALFFPSRSQFNYP